MAGVKKTSMEYSAMKCPTLSRLLLCPIKEDPRDKNTIRDGDSTALYTTYTVNTVNSDYTVYTAYNMFICTVQTA